MATRKNTCSIVLYDRKWEYTTEVSEEFLENFLDQNLDSILANEVHTRVNELRIVTTREGVILHEGITKRLFAYIKNILIMYESQQKNNKTQS